MLDWWWAYTGSKLPEPASFAQIANAALMSSSLPVVVEWWWARFLEHRTPEHTFGTILHIENFHNTRILDWYCEHYNETPGHFTQKPEQSSHDVIFTINRWADLPILQWAVDKCAVLDGQKLKLSEYFVNACISNGSVAMLDLIVHSMDVVIVDWSSKLLINAVKHGQLGGLE
ncbi:hypothetical protein BC828DRAFT_390976 [Blastocladiella britannica]|nr:hypothetical protein BC828DRAFT_390976 [Blastocladiella britannica]